ncbi:MAG: hypothetical protein IT260_04970 [Saprospiraceae bacterium]|nr:hypothetical protein [Saprospiraceae bacterium]
MRYFSLVFLLFLFSFSSFAQTHPYAAIDAHADSIREDNFSKLDQLTARLIEPARNDTERVRELFCWIAKNIKYDHEGLHKRSWQPYDLNTDLAAATFAWKKGICGGFSVLLKYMLDAAGIENALVTGHGKGESFLNEDRRSNHVWNSVRLGGQWQLLDVTWATTQWTKQDVSDLFFLPPPARFALSHYPDSLQWLLYDNPLPYELYQALPEIGYAYYTLGFGPEPPRMERDSGQVTFRLAIPKSVTLGVILRNVDTFEETILPTIQLEREGDLSVLRVPLPAEGHFDVELTAISDKTPYRKYFAVLTAPYPSLRP